MIHNIVHHLSYNLSAHNILAEVTGRIKDPISILNKLQKKGSTLEQLTDIVALRVIVSNMIECFEALDIVHKLYEHEPDKFKDFILNPKNNGYQSLHTVILINQLKRKVEVQIRDQKMHQHAEFGEAAHWKYKNTTENEFQKIYNNILMINQAYKTFGQANWIDVDLITYEQAIKNIYFMIKPILQ